MFLLILLVLSFVLYFHLNLHSTMFLLIPRYLIFLIFPTFSLLFLSILDSICVFPLYSHLKIIIYLLFMPLSMSPVFYFIEHRQFYNFIFLTAYAISFNFLNVYSYFSTYQQTHCYIFHFKPPMNLKKSHPILTKRNFIKLVASCFILFTDL